MKKSVAALILAFWLWGSMYVVSKMAYSYIPPLTVLMFRYIAACIFLAFFVFRKGFRRISRGHLKYFIFLKREATWPLVYKFTIFYKAR